MSDPLSRLGLAELLAASGALAALRDRAGRFTWASPSYLDLIGATADRVAGSTLADWIGPELAAPVDAEDERVWRTGEPLRWRPSDPAPTALPGGAGRQVWLAGHKLLLHPADGEPLLGMVAVDVGDWLADRTALAVAEQRLAQFVAHAPVLAMITDERHRYVWFGEAGHRLLRRPLGEVVGRTVPEVLPPELAEQSVEQNAAVLLSGTGRQVRLRTELDGREVEWSGYRFPLPQPDGTWHVGTILFDVTEFRAAQREVALWRNRFLTLLDRISVPTAVCLPDGRLSMLNPEFAALLGSSPGRLHGTLLTSLMQARDQEKHDRLMREFSSGKRGKRTLAVRWRPRRAERERTGELTIQLVKDVETGLLLTLAADPEQPEPAVRPPEISIREAEIITRVAAGDTTAAIAAAIGLTPDGVTYHVTRLCQRFGAANRTALVARAYVTGVLDASAWPPVWRRNGAPYA
ncbi:PAS domain-containing protein [Crossiella sp. CA-258035]|uniref:PAS domain-containing protein n=1 Tax=Crossiella sp. CA-258035 TaxID=2981138 RepID=UPI0024BC3C4B|nr:PAS domain-containing protein [Crossiella sp. CA-258035]WHT22319.1 PAS domain-containing protein [Crossiella sp. CA-258035]